MPTVPSGNTPLAAPSPARLSLKLPVPEDGALVLAADMPPLTEEELFDLCQENPELWIERTAEGDLIIMPPAGAYSGHRGLNLAGQLAAWAKRDGTGVGFDASTGFRLPGSRALRAPDASWVRRSRLAQLTARQKQRFLPLCPDFLIEIASPSDRPADLQKKMREYRAAGLPLGWLIIPSGTAAEPPAGNRVEIWTPAEIKTLANPASLSADPILPGFTLDLAAIWSPPF